MQRPEFVEFVREECAAKGVTFLVSPDASVTLPETSIAVNGYFNDSPEPILAVATGKPEEQWFPVLVHEYCHMLQWAEKAKVWEELEVGAVGTHDLMDLWLEHRVELITPEQLDGVFHPAMAVEWDCERRVVELVEKLQLPIDLPRYVQGANAYVLFYHAVRHFRQWYAVGREPYNLPEVYSQMPTTLVANFKVIDSTLFRALLPALGAL